VFGFKQALLDTPINTSDQQSSVLPPKFFSNGSRRRDFGCFWPKAEPIWGCWLAQLYVAHWSLISLISNRLNGFLDPPLLGQNDSAPEPLRHADRWRGRAGNAYILHRYPILRILLGIYKYYEYSYYNFCNVFLCVWLTVGGARPPRPSIGQPPLLLKSYVKLDGRRFVLFCTIFLDMKCFFMLWSVSFLWSCSICGQE